jgi:hypothetical protein
VSTRHCIPCPPSESPHLLSLEQIDAILEQSVAEVLRHEDPQRYLAWMRDKAREFFGHLPFLDEGGAPAMAAAAARSIWNATPLPGNQLRPRPMPPPERNAPCPCGSGRKYKHCCAGAPPLDVGHADDLWPRVVRHLTPQALSEALAHRRIPGAVLDEVARRYLDEGRARKAADLLEPLFEGEAAKLDERYEGALDALCDSYLALGYEYKRMALLERVAAQGNRTLARAALERMASMHLDRGDHGAAWEAFRKAQRAEPDNPSLVVNEITLLVAERRFDEAAQRARFWVAKLRKSEWEYGHVIDALEEIARDPGRAVADSYLEGRGIDASRLRTWVGGLGERALPEYTLVSPEPIDLSDPQQMGQRLREEVAKMGLPPAEQERAVRKLLADLKRLEKQRAREPDLFEEDAESHAPTDDRELTAPERVRRLEDKWRRVFPADKPMLTELGVSETDAWEPDACDAWLDFLETHPEAWDSLDILDDVAAALHDEEARMPEALHGTLSRPLAERGHAIVARAVGEQAVTLPWAMMHNRPRLRLTALLIHICGSRREAQRAADLMQWMLRVNPHDNHGYRCELTNHLLRSRHDQDALDLIGRYPGDMHAETAYGATLALLRLGREAEARAALLRALQTNDFVPEYLCQESVRRPKFAPHGVSYGGRDQAWLYREQARDLWLATPGALDWLKRTAKAVRREHPDAMRDSFSRIRRTLR